MIAVHESLQQLVQRRERDLGTDRGPISHRQVWLRGGGDDAWSYETVRRIAEGKHRRIGDKVADTLAVALDVPVSLVLAAAGQRPRLGRFELPRRADRLTERERDTIIVIIDTILAAADEAEREPRRPLRRVARQPATPRQRDVDGT